MTFGRAVGRRGDYIMDGGAVQATDSPRILIMKRSAGSPATSQTAESAGISGKIGAIYVDNPVVPLYGTDRGGSAPSSPVSHLASVRQCSFVPSNTCCFSSQS